MKALRIAFAALAAAILICGGARAAEGDAPAWPGAPEPDAVLAAFRNAVDRGELMVFEQKLDRSMISPRRIEYLFALEDLSLTVRVYADLRRPLAVPGRSDCEVRAVAAVLDAAGSIVDVEVHVWQKPGVRAKASPQGAQCPAAAAGLPSRKGVAG
jgi:hypothetical protein